MVMGMQACWSSL